MAKADRIRAKTPTSLVAVRNAVEDALPPIGVFWDIENCHVPKNKSAVTVVQYIRELFFNGHREAEFMCVCDTNKESKEIIQELNNAQVTVVHINATCKNAADDKLRQCMRRFADIHGAPATIILISGDVNFAPDLSDLRHRRKLTVIILHNGFASETLLVCANQHFSFTELVSNIPIKPIYKPQYDKLGCELVVTNLPTAPNVGLIKNRLKLLSDNCGGKVIYSGGGTAVLKFSSHDYATRAKKRLDNEEVFGNKISVNFPSNEDSNPGRQGSPRHQNKKSAKLLEYSSPDRDRKGSQNGTPTKGLNASSKQSAFPPPPPCVHSQNGSNTNGLEAPFRVPRSWGRGYSSHNGYSTPGMETLLNAAVDGLSIKEERVQQTTGRGSSARIKGGVDPPSAYDGQKLQTFRGLGSPCVDGETVKRKGKRGGWKSDTGGYVTNSDRFVVLPAAKVEKMPEGARPITGRQQGVMRASSGERKENGKRSGGGWSGRAVGQQISQWGSGTLMPEMSHSRRSTPSPTMHVGSWSSASSTSSSPRIAQLSRPPSFAASFNNESHFEPISSDTTPLTTNEPVDLHITNLDQGIEANEMKQYLLTIFQEHVMVLHVSVNLNPDGSLTAGVRVPSIQDAQYAISQLHRRRIGTKRILISIANSGESPPLSVLRAEVSALLLDVPGRKIPLFKFRELFEKRYHRSIGIAELHKLRDVATLQENMSGRIVILNSDYRNTPSPACSDGSKEVQEILEMSRCEIHCRDHNEGKGWAEKEEALQLPNVVVSLKVLIPNVHSLLELHANSIPLYSFPTCYECVFGKLDTVEESGVPLEHLLTCIPGIRIVRGPSLMKKIEWIDEKANEHAELRNISPPLANQLALFCREIVDLLKNYPFCRMPFSKFIPTYHHHFGRQCRVADYGYTKLIDLLEALPHVVQIIGEGNKRMLTLTHRAQIKRFTTDLLRMLKSQASKQVTLEEFSDVYMKCHSKPFVVSNYGVCDISDILSEIAEGTILVICSGQSTVIAIPKREQTMEETDRTRQFASEAMELLRHSPRYCMAFTKFIPAYHHHFGKQCRVADYGFTKLIELFEAIPDTVDILPSKEEGEDKMLRLTRTRMLHVFAEQIGSIMRPSGRHVMILEKLLSTFIQLHGYSLHPEDFGATDVRELLELISQVVKVVDTPNGPIVMLVDRGNVLHLSLCARKILLDRPGGSMSLDEFSVALTECSGQRGDITQICTDLKDYVRVEGSGSKKVVVLLPFQFLVRDVVLMLLEKGGRLPLTHFDVAYIQKFNRPCLPAKHGYQNLSALLHAMQEVVTVKGRSGKKSVVLNRDGVCYLTLFKEKGIFRDTSSFSTGYGSTEEAPSSASPIDLLSDPIPIRLPSPVLRPSLINEPNTELIDFASPCHSESSSELSEVPDGSASPLAQTLQLSSLSDDQRNAAPFSFSQNSVLSYPYFPPPSLVPPVPVSWMYQSLPSTGTQNSSPSTSPVSTVPAILCKTPTTPTATGHDSSENEINTPPYIRDLIEPSSAESTPQNSSRIRYRPRIAAQFATPITPHT